jgi:hypothetical protein
MADYESWVDGTGRPPALYGRRDAIAKIGAAAVVDPLQIGSRYTRITSPTSASLPALLAIYLAALDPLLR